MSPSGRPYTEMLTLNSMVPLWQRPKNKVTPEEYSNFYQEKFGGLGRSPVGHPRQR